MTYTVRDIPIHYVEHGAGIPVLCIHGLYVDHRMMVDALEPVLARTPGYRRIYIDLPGMGQTPAAQWVKSSDDMLDLLIDFVRTVIGDETFLLAGTSYGGYLSLGLMQKLGAQIGGALLLCPMVDPREDQPEYLPKRQMFPGETPLDYIAEKSGYREMAVMPTRQAYEKWQRNIQPAVALADAQFLANQLDLWYTPALHDAVCAMRFDKPACIITGRQDHHTGYQIAYELVARFPRATFATMDAAGHLLERDALVEQLVKDWIERTAH